MKRHVTIKHKSSNHPCEECSFKATSDSELKRHIFATHQKETPVKEIERCESLNDSLVLSLEKEERLDDGQTSLHLFLTNSLSLTPWLVLLLHPVFSMKSVHLLSALTMHLSSSTQQLSTKQGTVMSSSAVHAHGLFP